MRAMLKRILPPILLPLGTALGLFGWLHLCEDLPAPLLLFLAAGTSSLAVFFPARWSLRGFPARYLLSTFLLALGTLLTLGVVPALVREDGLGPAAGWGICLCLAGAVSPLLAARQPSWAKWPTSMLCLGGLAALVGTASLGGATLGLLALAGAGAALVTGQNLVFRGQTGPEDPKVGLAFLVFAWLVILAWLWGLILPVKGQVQSPVLALYSLDRQTWVLLALTALGVLVLPVLLRRYHPDPGLRMGPLWLAGMALGAGAFLHLRLASSPADLWPLGMVAAAGTLAGIVGLGRSFPDPPPEGENESL